MTTFGQDFQDAYDLLPTKELKTLFLHAVIGGVACYLEPEAAHDIIERALEISQRYATNPGLELVRK